MNSFGAFLEDFSPDFGNLAVTKKSASGNAFHKWALLKIAAAD